MSLSTASESSIVLWFNDHLAYRFCPLYEWEMHIFACINVIRKLARLRCVTLHKIY